MQPHIERMYIERNDLETKVNALQKFVTIEGGVFESLPKVKRELMLIQLYAMQTYLKALNQRIDLEK